MCIPTPLRESGQKRLLAKFILIAMVFVVQSMPECFTVLCSISMFRSQFLGDSSSLLFTCGSTKIDFVIVRIAQAGYVSDAMSKLYFHCYIWQVLICFDIHYVIPKYSQLVVCFTVLVKVHDYRYVIICCEKIEQKYVTQIFVSATSVRSRMSKQLYV